MNFYLHNKFLSYCVEINATGFRNTFFSSKIHKIKKKSTKTRKTLHSLYIMENVENPYYNNSRVI